MFGCRGGCRGLGASCATHLTVAWLALSSFSCVADVDRVTLPPGHEIEAHERRGWDPDRVCSRPADESAYVRVRDEGGQLYCALVCCDGWAGCALELTSCR